MLNKLESLLHKEMGRKEFLKAAGLAVVGVFGVGALLRLLDSKASAQVMGVGADVGAPAPPGTFGAVGGVAAVAAAGHPPHQPPHRRTLIRGGHIVTMDPVLGNLPVGDVLIEGDKIVAVGENLPKQGAAVIDAAGMIVIPGYVDNHKHLWESLVRGISSNATAQEHRALVLDPLPSKLTVEDVYYGTLIGALDSLSNGTTTIVNWDLGSLTLAHAMAAINALDDAGVRGLHSFSASRVTQDDPDSSPTEEEFLALADMTSRKPLLGLHMGTRNPVNRDVFPRVVRDFALARELGITISLHAGLATSVAVPGVLAENGLLGPDVMFVNGSAFTATEMALIKQHGAWITSVPEVEMQSVMPTPLGLMLAAGIKPTVSTDTYAYIPSNMPSQLRALLQAARQNGVQTANGMLKAADVFPYSNINPAESLGMSDRIGSLSIGKQADIVLINKRDSLGMLGTTDVFTDLILMAQPADVDTVLVAGRVVKRGGRLLGHNLDDLAKKLQKIQARLLA